MPTKSQCSTMRGLQRERPLNHSAAEWGRHAGLAHVDAAQSNGDLKASHTQTLFCVLRKFRNECLSGPVAVHRDVHATKPLVSVQYKGRTILDTLIGTPDTGGVDGHVYADRAVPREQNYTNSEHAIEQHSAARAKNTGTDMTQYREGGGQ